MELIPVLIIVAIGWQILRTRYQRSRIALLSRHLANLQIERHMETLTEGYTRAIREANESRQRQILETYAQTERAVAAQVQTLANAVAQDSAQATRMSKLSICIPYADSALPLPTRDFRQLLQIHADGFRYAVDNEAQWDTKSRAFHLSAELYLFQHSCHWFCRSRLVADARLQVQHKVTHQKVLESVSERTRAAYLQWLG